MLQKIHAHKMKYPRRRGHGTNSKPACCFSLFSGGRLAHLLVCAQKVNNVFEMLTGAAEVPRSVKHLQIKKEQKQ